MEAFAEAVFVAFMFAVMIAVMSIPEPIIGGAW